MSRKLKWYDALIVIGAVAIFLEVPPAIYGYLTYKQFEYFHVTGYMPIEEATIAFRTGDIRNILAAPLVALNMTSGHLFSNIYSFTVGAVAASVVLGVLTGLLISTRLRLAAVTGRFSSARNIAMMGFALVATVGASSAGLLGCHGSSGMSGGILTTVGMNQTTASLLAWISPYVQVLMIVAFAAFWIHSLRRLRSARGT